MQLQQIDYAPALPNQKRRRAIRRVVVGFAALLIAILAIKAAPRAWRHLQILYWQHRAMTYTAPADQVVYDDDPSDAAKVRASNPSLTVGSSGQVFDFAKPWDRLYQLVSPPGRQASATLFLHELQNSKGERRLVVVEFRPNSRAKKPTTPPQFDSVVITPGGLAQDPVERIMFGPQQVILVDHLPTTSVKWYAGQLDPRDSSHFTIRGVRGTQPVSVEGWLKDDWVWLSESP